MVKLVDRHIVGDLAPAFLLSVALFAGFIWIAAGPLLNAINYLAQGVPLWLVVQLAGLFLAPMMVLAFPMAMLIAVIMKFTRLSTDSEAVAMFASGISFYRLLAPTAAFAALVTVLGLVFNNSVVPAANKRISSFKNDFNKVGARAATPIDLPPLRSNNKLVATVHIEGGFSERDRALKKVTIVEFDPKTSRPVLTIYAESARWLGGSSWELQDGYAIGSNGIAAHFPSQLNTRDIQQQPDTIAVLSADQDTMSFRELSRRIAALKREGYGMTAQLREAEVGLWDKLALPCASFVFALVGAPLALKPQRAASRGVAFAWGIGLILAYYALFKFLDVLGANGRIEPALAAFIPNLLGLALAGYLTARATT